jgi:Cytochrome c
MQLLIPFLFVSIIFSCSEIKKSDNPILNDFEIENGIGPIKKSIPLTEIDEIAVEQGRIIYQTKCTSCHRLDTKLVGPPLRNIIQKRSPEYILNMIVNPVDMTLYHPIAKKLVLEYGSQMTFQNVNLNDAYKILDFLRFENNINK